jgi:hypothetical protein
MACEPVGIRTDSCSHVDGWVYFGVCGRFSIQYSRLPLLMYLPSLCRLGDRHCENILLDYNSGDVVHVDFNCLFEKVRWSHRQ